MNVWFYLSVEVEKTNESCAQPAESTHGFRIHGGAEASVWSRPSLGSFRKDEEKELLGSDPPCNTKNFAKSLHFGVHKIRSRESKAIHANLRHPFQFSKGALKVAFSFTGGPH
uniref:Uncharacterized protein n=1 Tax=Nelumbo nucifera TaxID=4432 RepID=A0A822XMI0_NELNU|nr:TPA_asm: hypothetical protein HUJ06_023033 [Nelumbo nucifera]